MNILCAIHHYPPHHTGGAEWHLRRLAHALSARGHRLRVLCVERIDAGVTGGCRAEDDADGAVRVRRLSFNAAAAPDPFHLAYDNGWVGAQVGQWIAAERPDAFWLFGGYLVSGSALRAAHDAGVASVVSLTDFWFLCPRITMLRSDGTRSVWPVEPVVCARCLGEERRVWRWAGRAAPRLMGDVWRRRRAAVRRIETRREFLREQLDRAAAIVCPSQVLRSVFLTAGVDAQRLVHIRQGHDAPPAPPAARHSRDPLRVGYLSQIVPHKGLHVLLDAARRLPSAALAVEIYGDPRKSPAYTAQLAPLLAADARLQLRGSYAQDEVGRVLAGLDVVVVPSLWYDNSPNVVLEALAHRTPVVVSDLGGTAEAVTDGRDGLHVPPGDGAALARQLARLLDEPGLLAALRAGIGSVKSLAAEVDEYDAVFHRIASPA